jgi:histidyl-tRNA synthetase
MNTQIHVFSNEAGTLTEDAPALMADVTEEKVSEGIVFGGGRKIPGRVRTMHEHPYEAIGIAFGVSALIGCLLARRICR